MKRVSQLLKAIGFLMLLAVAGFSAFFLIGISMMGDRSCTIKLKNDGQREIILKTFQFGNYTKKLTVDSIAISPGNEFEIGHCINCSTPDTTDISFDAMVIYNLETNPKLFYRVDLIKYLETKDKEGCITYVIR